MSFHATNSGTGISVDPSVFLFFNPLSLSVSLSFPLTAFLSLCLTLSLDFLSRFPSLNLINSFSSYQDGIRQKRLYLEAEGEKFSANAFVRFFYCTIVQLKRERAERARQRQRAYSFLRFRDCFSTCIEKY